MLHELGLLGEELAYFFDFAGGDGDDAGGFVAVGHDLVAVVVGLAVGDDWGVDADVLAFDA